MIKILKCIFIVVLAAAVAFAFQGYASAEAMAAPARGEGVGQISGYTVTELEIQLGPDPSQIGAVAFELDGPAEQVWVGFDAAGEYFPCRRLAGTRWLCEVEGVGTGEVEEIHISAGG